MTNKREQIAIIKIGEKDYEESDVAIINIFPPKGEIGIGISTRKNGDAELWITKEECLQIINSLKEAIKRVEELESE